jgi:hypothetical protein
VNWDSLDSDGRNSASGQNNPLTSAKHQEEATMFNNDLNRIRSGFIIGAIGALLLALPSGLFAQSSPLTVQPSTGRVGVGDESYSNV